MKSIFNITLTLYFIIRSSLMRAAIIMALVLTTSYLCTAQIVQQLQPAQGLDGARSMAVSPDNNHVYTASYADGAIMVYNRNTGTGELTFVEMLEDGGNDAASNLIDGLNGAYSVTVSPDNNHVYVASLLDDAIAVFSRNTSTGILTFVETLKDGVNGVDGLDGARSVSVSSDNNHVYVASNVDHAIAVFSRNTSTGVLTFVETLKDGVNGVDGLNNAYSVTVSPDNNHVYVASNGGGIATFSRNTSTGVLTFVEKLHYNDTDVAGNVLLIYGISTVTISPDNNHVYVGCLNGIGIIVFSRNTTTGRLTLVEILEDGGTDAAGNALNGLNEVRSIAVSPDNNYVYASGQGDDAVTIFSRNTTTGALTFVNMVQDEVDGVSYLDGASSVAVSQDNSFLYALSYTDDGLVVFETSLLPVELTYFKGQAIAENSHLTWQTASEKNNDGFHIQRSEDGLEWKNIGFVIGNGTTQDLQNYTYIDETPFSDINYYRLKQVDYNGKHEYSHIVNIEFQNPNAEIRIFPNPTSEIINIENGQNGDMVQIFSTNGQLIKEFEYQSPVNNHSITNLPKGTYFIKIGKTVKHILIQ